MFNLKRAGQRTCGNARCAKLHHNAKAAPCECGTLGDDGKPLPKIGRRGCAVCNAKDDAYYGSLRKAREIEARRDSEERRDALAMRAFCLEWKRNERLRTGKFQFNQPLNAP
jgi:hypothetical protein